MYYHKSMKTIICVIVLVCMSIISYSSDTDSIKEGELISTEDALIVAIEYLGFTGYDSALIKDAVSKNVELIKQGDSLVPFLQDQLNGISAWQVTFRDVFLDTIIEMRTKLHSLPKDITVLIDAQTGLLLKLIMINSNRGIIQGQSDELIKDWTQPLHITNESYHSLNDKRLNMSFIEAIDRNKLNITFADVVVGLQVMYTSWNIKDQRPVWLLNKIDTLAGSGIHGDTVSITRWVIDSEEGCQLMNTCVYTFPKGKLDQ